MRNKTEQIFFFASATMEQQDNGVAVLCIRGKMVAVIEHLALVSDSSAIKSLASIVPWPNSSLGVSGILGVLAETSMEENRMSITIGPARLDQCEETIELWRRAGYEFRTLPARRFRVRARQAKF